MPRFELSRELFLLDGGLGSVLTVDPDFPASLDPADGPSVDD